MGVKIYDTISKKLITKIGREPKSPCPKVLFVMFKNLSIYMVVWHFKNLLNNNL